MAATFWMKRPTLCRQLDVQVLVSVDICRSRKIRSPTVSQCTLLQRNLAGTSSPMVGWQTLSTSPDDVLSADIGVLLLVVGVFVSGMTISHYFCKLASAGGWWKLTDRHCLDCPWLYDKSAKDKSANDTSAKPIVRMPTVRKGQRCEWDTSANAKCANASSAMRHRCEKSATAVRMTTCEKDTVAGHACTALPTKARVLGSSTPLFFPDITPFLTITALKLPETLTLTQVQELKRFGELFQSTLTDQVFDDLFGSVSLPLPLP